MISKLKTAIVSGLIALGAIASFVPVQAQASENNGWGIVYHRSDCGAYSVRAYGFGGRGSGSSCGYWADEQARTIIWSMDWNWSQCDIAKARGNAGPGGNPCMN